MSEWDRINTEVKALVSGGLFVTNWKTFMSCNCVEGEKEYLRLGECGLRVVSLRRAKPQAKWQTNQEFQRE